MQLRNWLCLAGFVALIGCIGGPDPLPPEAALREASQAIDAILQEEAHAAAGPLEPPQTPDDPRKLTFWYYTHPVMAPAFGSPSARAGFERAHPGVRLSTQFIGDWGIAVQKLTVALAAGAVPDVALVKRSWLARLIPSGRLAPLDTVLPASVVADLREPSKQAFTVNGRLYALPADGFCSVLYVNRGLVAAAPRNWAELRETARRAAPQVGRNGCAVGNMPFLPALWSAGGYVVREGPASGVGLDEAAARKALDFLLSLKQERLADARLLANEEAAFRAFLAGDVAMTVASSARLPQTRDLPFQVAVGPVPGEQGPVSELSDDAIVVFRRFADAKFEAISAFLDYLTGPALQGADALALGSVPVRASVAESVIVPDELAAAYGVARATPLVPAWGRVEAVLDRYLGLAYAWQGPDGAKPAP